MFVGRSLDLMNLLKFPLGESFRKTVVRPELFKSFNFDNRIFNEFIEFEDY
jgi:hypothetical protein